MANVHNLSGTHLRVVGFGPETTFTYPGRMHFRGDIECDAVYLGTSFRLRALQEGATEVLRVERFDPVQKQWISMLNLGP